MKKTNKLSKEIKAALIVIAIIAAGIMYYSHKTACPNVAVYVKCKSLF